MVVICGCLLTRTLNFFHSVHLQGIVFNFGLSERSVEVICFIVRFKAFYTWVNYYKHTCN